MKKEEMLAIFTLSGIPVLKVWEIKNKYWPEHYVDLIAKNPWWLVQTPKGLIEIGNRKHVISIDWEDTGINCIVTEDNVTKDDTSVHAWSQQDAITYLKILSTHFEH
jgi:hypothetical protein